MLTESCIFSYFGTTVSWIFSRISFSLSNAIDNGYFDEEGLEVELVQFTSGATELAAMASGQINIGYLGVGAHVFAP